MKLQIRFSVLFQGIINNPSVSTQSSYDLYQTHAWVSRVVSHATALNIGIIIFVQRNHSSRFHTSLLNTQVVFRAQKKTTSLRLQTFLLEMWRWWWRENNRNVAVVVEGKQQKCGGGGGGKTIKMWWRWRENNRNVGEVVEGKQQKCGGGGIQFHPKNKNVVAVVYSFIIKIRPSHFYCFPSTTTTTAITFLVQN